MAQCSEEAMTRFALLSRPRLWAMNQSGPAFALAQTRTVHQRADNDRLRPTTGRRPLLEALLRSLAAWPG
jgi:hypothetical protein